MRYQIFGFVMKRSKIQFISYPIAAPPFASLSWSTPQATIISASLASTSFLMPPINLIEPTTRCPP